MSPEHRQEGPPLIPSDEELPVPQVPIGPGIVPLPVPGPPLPDEEAPDVHGPVGHAAGAEMRPGCDLAAQGVPGGGSVPGPEHGTVPLLPCGPAAGQVEHPLVPCAALPLAYGPGVEEAEGVHHLRREPQPGVRAVFLVHPGRLRALHVVPFRREGLAVVAPPGVHATVPISSPHLVPVQRPPLPAQRVVDVASREQQPPVPEFPVVFRTFIHVRPDGEHEAHALPVELPDHPGRIREPSPVKGLLAPLPVLPGAPVQNYAVQPDPPLPVLPGCLQDFLLGLVALLGLQVAEGPLRQQGRLPCQHPVLGDDAVHGGAVHEVEVHLPVRLGVQIGAVCGILEDHGAVRVHQDAVALRGHQQRHRNLAVGLVHVDGLTPQGAEALLVLPQAEQPLLPVPFQVQPGMEARPVGDPGGLPHHVLDAVRGRGLLDPAPLGRQAVHRELLQHLAVLSPLPQEHPALPVAVAAGGGLPAYLHL